MKVTKKYHGVVVPMISPFTVDGAIDLPAVQNITEHLVGSGTHPFILGTTGEGPSMPLAHRTQMADAVVRQTGGRATVYAGIGSLCLDDSIEAAKRYFDVGVNAVVCQLPSYFPLRTDAMLRYYETLADKVPGPLVLYNIPLTTHMSIPLEVIDKLSIHSNIVAFKDSEGDEERFRKGIAMWKDREDFSHFAGTETLAVKALLFGSDGIVPSTGNIVPKLYRELYEAGSSGDEKTAFAIWKKSLEVSQIYLKNRILSESLPALKTVMNVLGFCENAMLPPLYACSAEERATIKDKILEKVLV